MTTWKSDTPQYDNMQVRYTQSMTASIANAWGDRPVSIATEAQRHGWVRVLTSTKKAECKGLCLLFRLRGSRGRRIPRASWLSSLAKSASYRLSERPLPTLKRNRKAIEEDTQHHPLTLTFKRIYTHTYMYMYDCTQTCTYIHLWTYKHTHTQSVAKNTLKSQGSSVVFTMMFWSHLPLWAP